MKQGATTLATSVLWVRYGYPHLWVRTFLDMLPWKATFSSHIKNLILKSNVILILMTQITYRKGYLLLLPDIRLHGPYESKFGSMLFTVYLPSVTTECL